MKRAAWALGQVLFSSFSPAAAAHWASGWAPNWAWTAVFYVWRGGPLRPRFFEGVIEDRRAKRAMPFFPAPWPGQAVLLADVVSLCSQLLPSGVEGLVGMFRNWTFTLFFCM